MNAKKINFSSQARKELKPLLAKLKRKYNHTELKPNLSVSLW